MITSINWLVVLQAFLIVLAIAVGTACVLAVFVGVLWLLCVTLPSWVQKKWHTKSK